MKIAVVGAGFVGKATGIGLSKHNNNVVFIDSDEQRVDYLKQEKFNACTPDQYTKISTDVTMFCVPTPTKGENIQLNYLRDAVIHFAKLLKKHDKYHVIVIRSTVPPKTTRDVVLPLIEKMSDKKVGKDFGIAMQPEYLREKTAEDDFSRPWFVLIGQYDDKSGDVVEKIYKTFDAPIERVGLEEAEFQKYVHNVFNGVKIAFYNEMRLIAKAEKWDEDAIFKATAESCEAMWNPLYGTKDHGPFDGACLPKDSRALLEWADKRNYQLEILRSVIKENLLHEKLLGKNKTVRVNYLGNISA